MFPPISNEQQINSTSNNRFNTNVGHKNPVGTIDSKPLATTTNASSNKPKPNDEDAMYDLSNSRSRSASSNEQLSEYSASQLQQFVAAKSIKSNPNYTKLLSQISLQLVEQQADQAGDKHLENLINSNIELIRAKYLSGSSVEELDEDSANLTCFACLELNQKRTTFKQLNELRVHLVTEHDMSVNVGAVNELVFKYVRELAAEFSELCNFELSDELIVRVILGFLKTNRLKVEHFNYDTKSMRDQYLLSKKAPPHPFSTESLLSKGKSFPTPADSFNMSEYLGNGSSSIQQQQTALLGYLSAMNKNQTSNQQALLNQFLLPLMFSQTSGSQLLKGPAPDTTTAQTQSSSTPQQHDELNEDEAGRSGSNDMANSRRRRTRITEEQLKVLRQYFDINKSPSDEQITDIAQRTQLQAKVIKHWFRNTLFKERQKDKDSPYNFNNPPVTQLNLEEYEKTGKIVSSSNEPTGVAELADIKKEMLYESVIKAGAAAVANSFSNILARAGEVEEQLKVESEPVVDTVKPHSMISSCSGSSTSSINEHDEDSNPLEANYAEKKGMCAANQSIENAQQSQQSGQRPNRTKFSNTQIRALNQAFKQQNYPKDEQIAKLGKLLKKNF